MDVSRGGWGWGWGVGFKCAAGGQRKASKCGTQGDSSQKDAQNAHRCPPRNLHQLLAVPLPLRIHPRLQLRHLVPQARALRLRRHQALQQLPAVGGLPRCSRGSGCSSLSLAQLPLQLRQPSLAAVHGRRRLLQRRGRRLQLLVPGRQLALHLCGGRLSRRQLLRQLAQPRLRRLGVRLPRHRRLLLLLRGLARGLRLGERRRRRGLGLVQLERGGRAPLLGILRLALQLLQLLLGHRRGGAGLVQLLTLGPHLGRGGTDVVLQLGQHCIRAGQLLLPRVRQRRRLLRALLLLGGLLLRRGQVDLHMRAPVWRGST